MERTRCPKCGTVDYFNACGSEIVICDHCGNVHNARFHRLADKLGLHSERNPARADLDDEHTKRESVQ